jgi:hypothetical protein
MKGVLRQILARLTVLWHQHCSQIKIIHLNYNDIPCGTPDADAAWRRTNTTSAPPIGEAEEEYRMTINPGFGRAARAIAFAAAAAFAAGSLAPAIAAASQNAPAEQPAKAEPKKIKKYCVRTETTGSRTSKLECKTRADWVRENGFDPLRAD